MKLGIAALMIMLAGAAAAQQPHHGPYAGLQQRATKALCSTSKLFALEAPDLRNVSFDDEPTQRHNFLHLATQHA